MSAETQSDFFVVKLGREPILGLHVKQFRLRGLACAFNASLSAFIDLYLTIAMYSVKRVIEDARKETPGKRARNIRPVEQREQ